VATYRVILRFRELTPGVDTISEHERILREEGYVWWGWWKKETETDLALNFADLSQAARSSGVQLTLIDTSAERMHFALADEVAQVLPNKERERVPPYYRAQARIVFAWFRLTKIDQDVGYDAAVERLIGNRTCVVTESGT
jgi:hypothetical protein